MRLFFGARYQVAGGGPSYLFIVSYPQLFDALADDAHHALEIYYRRIFCVQSYAFDFALGRSLVAGSHADFVTIIFRSARDEFVDVATLTVLARDLVGESPK